MSQKHPRLLRQIAAIMGGGVYWDRSWDGWLYAATSREDIGNWVCYFSQYPLRSWKGRQLQRFKRVFLYKGRGVHLQCSGRPHKRFLRLLEEFRGRGGPQEERINEIVSRKI